jgi:hypothetical protein
VFHWRLHRTLRVFVFPMDLQWGKPLEAIGYCGL